MTLSKLLATAAAVATLVGSIGFAQAQTTATDSKNRSSDGTSNDGPKNSTAGSSTTRAEVRTNAAGDTDSKNKKADGSANDGPVNSTKGSGTSRAEVRSTAAGNTDSKNRASDGTSNDGPKSDVAAKKSTKRMTEAQRRAGARANSTDMSSMAKDGNAK